MLVLARLGVAEREMDGAGPEPAKENLGGRESSSSKSSEGTKGRAAGFLPDILEVRGMW